MTLTPSVGHLRRDRDDAAASIVVPVNAQGDLDGVNELIGDVATYGGQHSIEVMLVINNYPPEQPPAEIEDFRNRGVEVLAIPSLHREGYSVSLRGRMEGARAAVADPVILFDADCRLPNPTALIDWYVAAFARGADVAYTHVGHHDLPPDPSLRVRIAIHHAMRWIKRSVLRIPTTRGSNFAVRRSRVLPIYEDGRIADEMQVGPATKADGGRVVYGGGKDLVVLTSSRRITGGWRKIGRYVVKRVAYNLRVLPTRADAARHTGRRDLPRHATETSSTPRRGSDQE